MENIKSRIAKLLRLAQNNGATEAEAANAMAKAAALMAEHNISQSEAENVADKVNVKWGEWRPAHNKSNWPMTVISVASELYGCRYVYKPRSRSYRFAGRPDNIDAAEQTFDYLIEQINAIYKIHLKQFGGRLSYEQRCEYRDSFKAACAMRLIHRVWEIKAAMTNSIPNHKALVVVQQQDQSQMDAMWTEAKVKEGRSLSVATGSGTGAGIAAGNQIRLQHAATNSPARRIGQ